MAAETSPKEIELQMTSNTNTEEREANLSMMASGQLSFRHLHTDDELLTMENSEVDKKALWGLLKATQCPLIPAYYEGRDKGLSDAYYFNGDFWIGDKDNAECCRMMDFPSAERKRMAMDDAELILAVDEYIKDVRVNKSFEIYEKLQLALAEKKGQDDGDDTNDAYQKLMPTTIGRIVFISVFFTTALNGYFLTNGFFIALSGQYETDIMNILALVMSICELVLYCNILLGRVLSNGLSMLFALLSNRTTYIQSKTIAQELRSLSTLSMLRYMPSIEIVSSWIIHWRESLAHIWTEFFLLIEDSVLNKRHRNICQVVFAIPCYVIETFAPILAMYAILVKIKQLGFAVEGEPFDSWSFSQYITFIAFLNQVAGLRVLRNVETQSIQHFVFSGSDASLDGDELLLLDDWWNVTVLSAVSNLNLTWYDNMVFWYSLDPQKIQLLLKFHSSEADGDSLREMIKENDDILINYDQKVMKTLDKLKKDK